MQFHDIANVFPLIDEDDLQKLALSIRTSGLRHPVVLFEDKILDGRNRFRACQLVGVKPSTVEFRGDWEAAVKYVTDENLTRRHLNVTQRAMVATRLAELRRGRPSENAQIQAITETPVVTQGEAAKRLQVSRSSVQAARQVMERGVPELVDAVDKGEVSVDAAAKVAQLPVEEQREVVAGGKEKVKEKASEMRATARPARRAEPAVEDTALSRTACFAFLGALTDAARSMQIAISLFAKGTIELSDDEKDKIAQLVVRYRSGADWIEGLVSGEGLSDDALADWLKA